MALGFTLMSYKFSRTHVYIALVIVLALAVAALAYWSSQKPADRTARPDTVQPGGPDKTTVPNNPGPANSADVPQKGGVSVTITKLQEADDKVTLEGSVQGASAGTCVAEFTTPNDKPVVRQTNATKTSDNGAACGPFIIPAQQFAYLGDWQAVIKLYVEGGQAASPAKTLTIK
jgi:hypothetical protein